jgi:hypothetical protein
LFGATVRVDPSTLALPSGLLARVYDIVAPEGFRKSGGRLKPALTLDRPASAPFDDTLGLGPMSRGMATVFDLPKRFVTLATTLPPTTAPFDAVKDRTPWLASGTDAVASVDGPDTNEYV